MLLGDSRFYPSIKWERPPSINQSIRERGGGALGQLRSWHRAPGIRICMTLRQVGSGECAVQLSTGQNGRLYDI